MGSSADNFFCRMSSSCRCRLSPACITSSRWSIPVCWLSVTIATRRSGSLEVNVWHQGLCVCVSAYESQSTGVLRQQCLWISVAACQYPYHSVCVCLYYSASVWITQTFFTSVCMCQCGSIRHCVSFSASERQCVSVSVHRCIRDSVGHYVCVWNWWPRPHEIELMLICYTCNKLKCLHFPAKVGNSVYASIFCFHLEIIYGLRHCWICVTGWQEWSQTHLIVIEG